MVYYGKPVQKEIVITRSFTFIDPAGNQAQYTVYNADRHNEYYWSTDHGDSGFEASYAQAQSRARTALKALKALKASMAVRRRNDTVAADRGGARPRS